MTAALAIERVSVHRSGARVVREACFDIAAGSWFGLIGANGSGKTSLLRAIAGRLPIDAGRCRIGGVDLAADRVARARAIGFAPSIDMLPGALLAREALGIVAGEVDAGLAALGPLRMALGIDDLLALRIGRCSAGMRQRIAIACAFAAGHRTIVLDEPFNWLDPVAAYDVRQALGAMVKDGLTLLTALHDLTTLAAACGEGALLSGGAVARAIDREAMREARRDPAAFERRTIDLLRARPL